jgi:photosystem II stability/assembly factor-like uncharacterized protein
MDAGSTWLSGTVAEAEDLDFRDIHAWDRERALVLSAGFPAKIYLTVDGGSTWDLRYVNETPDVFFNAVEFWDDGRGIAVGDPMEGRFLLITSSDRGETWKELPMESRPQALHGEAGFAASGTCLEVFSDGRVWFGTGGPEARVHRSKDWGENWTAAQTPLRAGVASQGVFSLHFASDLNGTAVGGDYRDEPNPTSCAAVTCDGGASWSPAADSPSGFRECVAAMSAARPKLLMAVGPSGADLSEDGGLSWRTIGDQGFHVVSFSADGTTGIAVGAAGSVAKWVARPN